jgi:hypothetical protein
MGGMVMGECKNRQKKFCIIKKNCKHFEGGYGKLPLGNVYTCHGFFIRMHEFKEANSRTIYHKLT